MIKIIALKLIIHIKQLEREIISKLETLKVALRLLEMHTILHKFIEEKKIFTYFKIIFKFKILSNF